MNSETIRRVNGYEKDAYTYIPVIIVGAGASGIAMACQLKKQLGFDQFRVFERQAGIGGTWWINRYPGVAWYVSSLYGHGTLTCDRRVTRQHIANNNRSLSNDLTNIA
jgi:predicted NAD/FAD-dependent oxidoreductase